MHRFLLRKALVVLLTMGCLPAFAHFPFDMPGPAPTFEQAVVLPDSQSTWNIYGVLPTPGAIDFIRLNNLDNEQVVNLEMKVFARPTYAGFAPSFALIAPGLSQPSETLPFSLPEGYGAVVAAYTGEPAARPVRGSSPRITWVGQGLSVPDIAGGPAYLAIWHPTGLTGEYNLTYNITPDTHDPTLEGNFSHPVMGDGDGDGHLNTSDVVLALRTAVGLEPPSARRLRALDVIPLKGDNLLHGDGQLTVGDAIRLLQRIVGLDETPFP